MSGDCEDVTLAIHNIADGVIHDDVRLFASLRVTETQSDRKWEFQKMRVIVYEIVKKENELKKR